jgi:hypothetical protein
MQALSSTGGSSNEPSAATPWLEPRDDYQDRVWRLGDRRLRLGIRLGTPGRRRFAGDHASRTGARGRLYALVGRLRLFAPPNIIAEAEEVMQLVETYHLPNRDFSY